MASVIPMGGWGWHGNSINYNFKQIYIRMPSLPFSSRWKERDSSFLFQQFFSKNCFFFKLFHFIQFFVGAMTSGRRAFDRQTFGQLYISVSWWTVDENLTILCLSTKCLSPNWLLTKWHSANGRAHVRHLCRKTAVSSCRRFLINSGVEKMNNF